MHIKNRAIPRASRLARIPELSKAARQRLKWMDYYAAHGRNASLASRYFGISRETFHSWKRRYDPRRLATLETRPFVEGDAPPARAELSHPFAALLEVLHASVDGGAHALVPALL